MYLSERERGKVNGERERESERVRERERGGKEGEREVKKERVCVPE